MKAINDAILADAKDAVESSTTLEAFVHAQASIYTDKTTEWLTDKAAKAYKEAEDFFKTID